MLGYMKDKLARARANVDENYDKEWAQRINEALKPCQICEANTNGELGDLLDGLFEETMKVHPENEQVKEYIQDWLFASGTYFMFEEGAICSMPAYHAAVEYADTLGEPKN